MSLITLMTSAVRAHHRLRVPAAGQAGAAPPRRPREAAQGDRAQEGGGPGRGSLQVCTAQHQQGRVCLFIRVLPVCAFMPVSTRIYPFYGQVLSTFYSIESVGLKAKEV